MLSKMRFGFLIFPDVQDLDLFGPWDLAFHWHKASEGPELLMVAENDSPLHTSCGATITPHCTLENCPVLDYLLIPGGQGTRKLAKNEPVLNFVRTKAPSCKAVLSVCTGSAYVLEPAGLLKGKKATTHWASLDYLRSCEDVTVIEQRYVQDGDVWTSAGVSAGMDMILAFIAHTAGTHAAGKVQIRTEYFPDGKRYGDLSNWEKIPNYIKQEVNSF